MVFSFGDDQLAPIASGVAPDAAPPSLTDVSLAGHDSKLDTITQLAVACGAGDAGGISIIYRSQIWLPSYIGITDSLLPQSGSFCGWVVDKNLPWFEVEDASRDERFSSNPLVAPKPRYTHYAAVSLGTSDSSLRGTLWIMSRHPRKLLPEQLAKLKGMGELAVDILKLKYCHPVTGMFNCSAFLHHLTILLSQHADTRVVVGCIALGDLSTIADRYGSESADAVLRRVGAALENWADEEVIAGHLEGNHFCFAFVDAAGGKLRPMPVLHALIEQAVAESLGVQLVKVNIGVWRDLAVAGIDARQLVDAAALAAMTANPGKEGGVREFDQAQLIRMRLHYHLQDAIRNQPGAGSIVVYYQPQIDISSGRIIGLEALARWSHPSFGIVGPDSFVPQAESRGEILALDLHILARVCADLHQWESAGLQPVPVALNFSRLSLLHPHIIDRVTEVLARTGVQPNLLEFEVTESALIEPNHPLHEPVIALRTLGVRVAVDDFGTGYSNLDALNSFPFDRLKVDRQFVQGVGSNPKTAGLFVLIQGIAELFGAEVLCEGLEHQSDLEWLQARGVTLVQGWYFSKARPLQEITDILWTLAHSSDATPESASAPVPDLPRLRTILAAPI